MLPFAWSTLVIATLAASPRDVGVVETRDDRLVARLSVGAGDLEPYCHPGIDGEVDELPIELVRKATGWTVDAPVGLFVGPRRVGTGHVEEIAVGEGCSVEAVIEPDGPMPWTLPSDVVWATVRDRPSAPPMPVRRNLVRAAERAAARELQTAIQGERAREQCLAEMRVTSRGFRGGAVVGVSCDAEDAAFGDIYVVRPNQSVATLRLPGVQKGDPIALVDLITPQAERRLDLVIEVPTPKGRERRWLRVAVR